MSKSRPLPGDGSVNTRIKLLIVEYNVFGAYSIDGGG